MKRIIALTLSVFLSVSNAYGQDDRLIAFLTEATQKNPRLKAHFSAYQAAMARIPQVGALPDPQLTLGLFVRPMHRFMGTQRAELTLTQVFPWFGTLAAAESEASSRARAVFERFRAAVSDVHYEVKGTYYAIHLLEREISITEDHVNILEQLEQTATARFGGGATGEGGKGMTGRSASGGMVDVLRVQMEVNTLRNKLDLLRAGRSPLEARFNSLLGRNVEASVVVADSVGLVDPPVPIADIPDSIRRHNPLLEMLAMESEAFNAQVDKHRRMGFPTVDLGVRYSLFSPREGSTLENNGRDMIMPMASVRIPLWRGKYRASIKEAQELRAASESRKVDEDNRLQASRVDVMSDFHDAKRRVSLFSRQEDLANQAQRILTVQYASGDGDFDEVLRMQLRALEYRLQVVNAVVDRNIAVAMLARLMGR